MKPQIKCLLAVCLVLMLASASWAQFDEALLKNLAWRNVGPAGAGGRVTDVAVAGEFPQHTIYVGLGTGGVWKSANNGVRWTPIFDDQPASSIGDIAVLPNNPNLVWVGTGEANGRNSVSWGNGVYKSVDGGKSWNNMGLADTRHIGRIAIDPRNPDVVYVAALGHMWGPNRERGLYKTTDGGLTWTNTLFLNDDTGFIDLAMDPNDSNTLYAAAHHRRRDGFAGGDPAIQWGPAAGIYKTTDAGRNWRRLTNGLPPGDLGRIGLEVSKSDPSIVYAIIQTPTTVPREGGGGAAGPPQGRPDSQKTMHDGGVFRSADKGESWTWMNPINPRPFYYSRVHVDPTNASRVYVLGGAVALSEDGGKTFRNLQVNIHVDHHTLWINPRNAQHMIIGNDGGLYFTYDAGRSWDFLNQIAISQFYSVDVDMRKPYFIYGGVQDYCSWGGPSATRNQIGITVSDWYKVQTGDGFQVRVDPTDHNILYAESQNGGIVRHDIRSGRNTAIRPRPESGAPAYRFNWETPIVISAHDPKTLYVGGNFLFRSADRGNTWSVISPELPAEKAGTITTIGESAVNGRVLYAGTDDGNVHVTRDGGTNWKNITGRFPGMAGKRWVSRLVASRFNEGTAFAAFDGHRNNDYAAYLFRTTDYGETWVPIKNNLPENQPVRVIREDYRNRNLLFAGTEFGAHVSIDGGAKWVRLMNRMPAVPVADLVIHPRDGDLVAGTHGRSFYVMDIGPLQELTEAVLASDAHLFGVKPAVAFQYRVFSDDQFLAEKRFVAENPPFGATIHYYLKNAASGDVKIEILDRSGAVIRELNGSKEKGMQRVQWDLRAASPVAPAALTATGQGGGGGGGQMAGPMVEPGEYTARLTGDGRQLTTSVLVEPDPQLQTSEQDRRRLRTTITSLFTLIKDAAPAVTAANALNEQIENLNKAVAKANLSAGLKSRIETFTKQVSEVRGKINTANGRVRALYGEVNNSPFAPTTTQTRETAELSRELMAQIPALNNLIAKLPELDRDINKENVPRITPVAPVVRPK